MVSGETATRAMVENRIVAIENADPGFDYLFSLGIVGLITAFGGPNSHMAIRAAEFRLPGVIGIGQAAFQDLPGGALVEIDGHKRRWQVETGHLATTSTARSHLRHRQCAF
jgi:phosphoenolpyruvate-protein kinase (PTS system EI component)